METIARSKDLYGPYEANSANPILTNANTTSYCKYLVPPRLYNSNCDIVQTVGHADLFQDARGNWWGVALSTRSGPEYITYPMGRETVLTNVTWANGSWPTFEDPVEGVMQGWQLPQSIRELPGNGSAKHLLAYSHGRLTRIIVNT
jgi:beta-xylosidase